MRHIVTIPPDHQNRHARRAADAQMYRGNQSRGRPYHYEPEHKSRAVINGRNKIELLILRGMTR